MKLTKEQIEGWRDVWLGKYAYPSAPAKLLEAMVELNDIADAALIGISARAEGVPSIPLTTILREADHIEQNGISLAKFGGQEIHEGRCRELCAMYLREFVQYYHMGERLKALDLRSGMNPSLPEEK